MNILLLGGTGFVGSYLNDYLSKYYHVDQTYCHQKITNGIKYNVATDRLDSIIKKEYDLIINNINPEHLSYYEITKGTEELVNFCKKNNQKLIQISSIAAFQSNKFISAYSLKKQITDDIIINELNSEYYCLLRFSQLFDNKGLAYNSQGGLYYIIDAVKNLKEISIFKNHNEIYRNYMPIEFLLKIIKHIIDTQKTGIYNSYIDKYTFLIIDFINKIVAFNPQYHPNLLLKKSTNLGSSYSLEPSSEMIEELFKTVKPIDYYLKKAYDNYHG